jgi:16S rRNA processing protein RimM
MDPTPFVPLGRIVKTHGLAGEVSVIATDGLPLTRLVGVAVWFVPPTGLIRTAVIAGVRPGPKGPLVRFEGVDGPDAAATLRGTTIVARPQDLPEGVEGPADEPDPVGLRVVDAVRGMIGEIDYTIATGANDVWVVTGGPFGEVLIPVIDSVVREIDWDAGIAHVELLDGLIEGE